MKLIEFDETKRKTIVRHYKIDELSEFTSHVLDSLYTLAARKIRAKVKDEPSVIKNSKLCIFQGSMISLDTSTIEDCEIFHSPINIANCTLKNMSIRNCHLFHSRNTVLSDCKFLGGTKDIEQSHPMVFQFDYGTIVNPKKNYIDFFGYINTYDFFLANLDKYPYSEYSSELNCIITMGTR